MHPDVKTAIQSLARGCAAFELGQDERAEQLLTLALLSTHSVLKDVARRKAERTGRRSLAQPARQQLP